MNARIFILTLLAGCAPVFAQLTIDVPAEVQAAIKREQADGKLVGFREVNESDGATYQVALLLDGKRYSLTLDAAGRVMGKDLDEERTEPKKLTTAQLPVAVKKTFYREAAGGSVREVEVREERKTYVTEVIVARRKYTIEVDADGKLIRKSYDPHWQPE